MGIDASVEMARTFGWPLLERGATAAHYAAYRARDPCNHTYIHQRNDTKKTTPHRVVVIRFGATQLRYFTRKRHPSRVASSSSSSSCVVVAAQFTTARSSILYSRADTIRIARAICHKYYVLFIYGWGDTVDDKIFLKHCSPNALKDYWLYTTYIRVHCLD